MKAVGYAVTSLEEVIVRAVNEVAKALPKELVPPRERVYDFVPVELTPEFIEALTSKKEKKVIMDINKERRNTNEAYVFPKVSKTEALLSYAFKVSLDIYLRRGGKNVLPAKRGLFTVSVPTRKGTITLKVTPFGEFRRALVSNRKPTIPKKRVKEYEKYLPFTIAFYERFAGLKGINGEPVITATNLKEFTSMVRIVRMGIEDDEDVLTELNVFSAWARRVIRKNGGKMVYPFVGEEPFDPPVSPPVVWKPVVAVHVAGGHKEVYSAFVSYDFKESERRGVRVGQFVFTKP